MEISEKDARKFALVILVILLAVLTFFIVRPVLLSVLGGLILAYVFFPVYKRISKFVRSENLAAALVSVLVLLIIFVPLWFLTPLMIKQMFQTFQLIQTLEIPGLIAKLIPGASEQLVSQLEITLNNALSQTTTSILNWLVDILINFATITLHLFLVAFVFFFALRDESKLREFVSGLSPLNKTQEKDLVKQFGDITSSIINGQIVAGIAQGILAGVGFLIFGVPNALILTILSVTLGIIPIVGVAFVYLPVTIYMLVSGNPSPAFAILYLAYNVLIVSSVDNLIKPHFVSRKTQLSQVIVIVGMIGGLFLFGALGLIIGPLVLAYFITFLRAYKDKNLSSFFAP